MAGLIVERLLPFPEQITPAKLLRSQLLFSPIDLGCTHCDSSEWLLLQLTLLSSTGLSVSLRLVVCVAV